MRRYGKAALLFLFIAVTASAQDSPLVTAARGGKRGLGAMRPSMPDVRIVRWFNSDKHSLADFRGQVLLVDFWTTWCTSCVAAHPKIQKMIADLGSQGFNAVLLHDRKTHTSRSNEVLAETVLPQYIAEHRITAPVAIADAHEFEELGVFGVPHYVLLDRRGRIRYSADGNPPDERQIRSLLAE
jgi:thiol-disulfide isomerase/thioredoxin